MRTRGDRPSHSDRCRLRRATRLLIVALVALLGGAPSAAPQAPAVEAAGAPAGREAPEGAAAVTGVAAAEAGEETAAPALLSGVEAHGFVDLYLTGNSNRPPDERNFYPGYGNSARRANATGLNLAGLELAAVARAVGFRLVVAAGDEMELLNAGEPAGKATSQGAFRYLYQASFAWATGLGRGLRVEGGLYPSHIGFESPLPRDNWCYTQGWTGNLTPSYQTGLKLAYPFTDALAGELHVVNGWQVTADNNDRPSLGAQLAWSPEWGSLVLNTWHGPELAGDDARSRELGDLVVKVQPHPRVSLAGEAIVGWQERRAESGGGRDDWTILAGWARLELGERGAVTLRAERVEDEAGAISGFAQTLGEGTLSFELRPRPELALKVEGRIDRSDAAVFTRDGATPAREQRLLVASAILGF